MEEKKFTTEELITNIKAFHFDSVGGNYDKDLLYWCNNWIDYNIKRIIDFETYMRNKNKI